VFDGIDVVTLPAAGLDDLLALYTEGLGFTVVADRPVDDPVRQRLWALPLPPAREVLLGKPGSQGGWLRLVDVPGLPEPRVPGRPDRDGAYALDFYVRGADRVEERLSALGWGYRSEAQHYLLPGTPVEVRERMLVQGRSGLLHAIVEYRPGQTRCVLAEAPGEDCSEVVAAVFFTSRLAEAAGFATRVLGARRYFSGRFDGPAVERMLGLAPGEGFEGNLFRGPLSRNARLEFAATMAPVPTAEAVEPDPVARVVAGCAVEDLDGLADRLADGAHGVTTGVLRLADGGRRLGLSSVYGAAFEFWQRGEPA
jgi:catechol 2,3-dioxygenase-like lactoylglutathione lyase family enzyme